MPLRRILLLCFGFACAASMPVHATTYPGFLELVTDSSAIFGVRSAPKPGHLVPVTDPTFGTRVTRMGGDPGAPFVMTATDESGTWGTDARHNYSKNQPWNADQTLLMLENPLSEGGSPARVILDGETYQPRYGRCSFTLDDARWHPSVAHARELIGVREGPDSLLWFDPTTCMQTRGWQLPFRPDGIGFGEGNASRDGRFIALANQNSIVIVDMDPLPPYASYDDGNRRIGPVYSVAPCSLRTQQPANCDIGNVSISPSGRYVDLKFSGSGDEADAHRIFEVDPVTLEIRPHAMDDASLRCATFAARPNGWIYPLKHADMTLDPFDGDEDVIVGGRSCSGSDLGRVVAVRLRDGRVTALSNPNEEASVRHVSARNLDRPGWVYVNYYRADGKRFSDEIVAVKLDGSGATQRFAHTHSDASCYRCEPHAVPSPDGRRVVFASNWTQDCGACGTTGSIQGYVIDAREGVTVDLPPVIEAAETTAATEMVALELNVTAADPEGDPIDSLTVDLSGLPAGHGAALVVNDTRTSGTLSWTPTYVDGGRSHPVRFTAANWRRSVRTVWIAVTDVDRAPVVVAASTVVANEGQPFVLGVAASDPDGDVITTLAPDLANLPAGHGATFATNGTNTAGTLTWTPAAGTGRAAPYDVSFAAANALSGSAATAIVVNRAPVAALVATPESGTASLLVTADASGSSDPDGSVAWYTFQFGDGASLGPQSAPTASHSYAAGTFTLTVTVTDDRGGTATASRVVTVTPGVPNLVANPGFETDLSGWAKNGTATVTRVAPGRSGGYCAEVRTTSSGSFGITDKPSWVATVPAAGITYRLTAWVRSTAHRGNARIKVREFLGGSQQGSSAYSNSLVLSPVWQPITIDYVTRAANSYLDVDITDYPVVRSEIFQIDDIVILPASTTPDQAPVVTAPVIAAVNENAQLVADVTAADPDGHPITALTANLSGLPAGHNATWTTNAAKTTGQLTWTPTYAHGRAAPYPVTFTATNALPGTAGMAITVSNVDRPPVVTAPATFAAQKGVAMSLAVSAGDPDGEAILSLTPNLANLPSPNDAVFAANAQNTGGTLTWTPLTTDGPGPYSVSFTASNAQTGAASTAIALTDVPADGANLVGNPGFETDVAGWVKNGTATIARVSPGHSGGYCVESRSGSSGTFGITDSPGWINTVPAAGITYRLAAWVRSAAHRGAGKIKVREFVGSTQQGSSAYSAGITLSPAWQQITFDYVTRTANSRLDVEVNDYSIAASEIIQIDDVSIERLSGGAVPAASQPAPAVGLAFRAAVAPNPIRSGGVLQLTTTRPGPVRLEIFDISGRLVAAPIREPLVGAGEHRRTFSLRNGSVRLVGGVYLYRLHAAEGTRSGRFVVLE